MRGKGELINKDENSENWCFICKDGGDLRICDYKQCLKSYHHFCLKKPKSFLESEKEWDCVWHRCSVCRKSSYIHCYTCPKSVCRNCVSTKKILQVKGQYGFCKDCLKLALLIEENKDCDSDGCKVDFTDRETEEGLHMEYYTTVKEDEGFELADIYAAKEKVKGKKRKEEEQISDYDDLELQKKKSRRSLKRSDGQKPAKQTPAKPNKENLGTLNPCKRQIKTDAEKSSGKINDVENNVPKQTPAKPNKENLGTLNPCKRKSKTDAEKSSGKINDVENNVPLKSRFASIVVENIKRVYLGRGVLKEMLKEADSFEEKVTGCFVRVKSSSYNHRPRSHQLVQVKGVKTVSIDENNTETVLLLSAMPNEIGIPLVSDEEITEEECEDLRKKVLAGEIERPTVEYLQQKVNDVHKDMTNHSIRKELSLLKHRIEQANENGWRFYMFECLERTKTLQSPKELTRLLENVPTVTADIYEPDRDSKHDVKGNGSSPESNNGDKTSEEENCGGRQIYPSEKDQIVSEKSVPNDPQHGPTSNSEPEQAKAKEIKDSKIEAVALPNDDDGDRVPAKFDDEPDNVAWCMKGPNGLLNKSVPFCVLRSWNQSCPHVACKFIVWREDKSEEDAIPLPEALIFGASKK